MPNDQSLSDYHSRAQTVREIALGLYDDEERRIVLEMADDFEKMVTVILRRATALL